MSHRVRDSGLFRKLRVLPKRGLGRIVETVVILWMLLRDDAVPRWAKVLIAATLAYLICPFDAVPDFLPGGYLDDIALLAGTLAKVSGFVTDETRERARAKRRELGL